MLYLWKDWGFKDIKYQDLSSHPANFSLVSRTWPEKKHFKIVDPILELVFLLKLLQTFNTSKLFKTWDEMRWDELADTVLFKTFFSITPSWKLILRRWKGNDRKLSEYLHPKLQVICERSDAAFIEGKIDYPAKFVKSFKWLVVNRRNWDQLMKNMSDWDLDMKNMSNRDQ